MEITTRVHMNDEYVSEKHNARDYNIVKYEKHIDTQNGVHEVWKDGNTRLTYENLFSDVIDEYNKKQKRKDRRIDGVHEYMKQVKADKRGRKKRKRKNGKLVVENDIENKKRTQHQGKRIVYEVVAGAGNTNLTKGDDGLFIYDEDGHEVHLQRLPYEVTRAATWEFYCYWDVRNPNFELVRVDWHADEFYINDVTKLKEWACEHAHIEFVPWADGYKQGLSVQQSISKALEKMGFVDGEVIDENGKKVWKCAYTKWLDREREVYEKCVEKAYREYCEKHTDYYEKHGDLKFVYPYKDKNAENMHTDKFREMQEADVLLDDKKRSARNVDKKAYDAQKELEQKQHELEMVNKKIETVQKQIEAERAAWNAEQQRAREELQKDIEEAKRDKSTAIGLKEAAKLYKHDAQKELEQAEQDRADAKALKEDAETYKKAVETEYEDFKRKIEKVTQQIVQKQTEAIESINEEVFADDTADDRVSKLAESYRKKWTFSDGSGRRISVEDAYQTSIMKANADIKARNALREHNINDKADRYKKDINNIIDTEFGED
nr:MAG TPA: Plasmid recombination enzyme [Caudoviricetes sp.]